MENINGFEVSIWSELGNWTRLKSDTLSEVYDPRWYILYMTEDLTNGKIYVGASARHYIGEDTYFGSGVLISEAIMDKGRENFRRTTLCRCLNGKEAAWLEKQAVNREFVSRADTYNLKCGGSVHRNKVENSEFHVRKAVKKGYAPRVNERGQKHHNAKSIIVTDPLGMSYLVHGQMTLFCKHNDLPKSSMYSILWGHKRTRPNGMMLGWRAEYLFAEEANPRYFCAA